MTLPTGYRTRAPTPDDLARVAAMIVEASLHDSGTNEYDEDDLRDEWGDPKFDLARQAVLVEEPGGAPVGYAAVFWRGSEAITGYGVVAPAHRARGVGAVLLEEQRARARALAGGRAVPHLTVVTPTDAAAVALVTARGYRFTRRFQRMEIALRGDASAGDPPPGIALRTLRDERDARAVHETLQESFAEHWGYTPASFEEDYAVKPGFDAALWFLALDGDDCAGALVARAYDDGGWVRTLGVRKPWRGRGIGVTLLRHAFAAFAARGLTVASLTVDSANETGATALYERVGMRVVYEFDFYKGSLEAR